MKILHKIWLKMRWSNKHFSTLSAAKIAVKSLSPYCSHIYFALQKNYKGTSKSLITSSLMCIPEFVEEPVLSWIHRENLTRSCVHPGTSYKEFITIIILLQWHHLLQAIASHQFCCQRLWSLWSTLLSPLPWTRVMQTVRFQARPFEPQWRFVTENPIYKLILQCVWSAWVTSLFAME